MKRSTIWFMLSFVSSTVFSQSSIPDPRYWVTDGSVKSIVRDGAVIYLGGEFNRVGPNTPFGTALDKETGLPDLNYSKPNGPVHAVVPDGKGGWFIGGRFTTVYGQERKHLARINGDGSLHPWNPVANGEVHTLAVKGDRVFVGGDFTMVGGEPRNAIASLDADMGFARSWNPDVTGSVRSLVLADGKVFFGGRFTKVGIQARSNMAAVTDSTGALLGWGGAVDKPVRCMAISGPRVIVGGEFTSIQGLNRNHIASLRIDNGSVESWAPEADAPVNALYADDEDLFAGGEFGFIGGKSRKHLAWLDLTGGSALNWNPATNGVVNALAVRRDRIYVGGSFDTTGGKPRNHIAVFDYNTGDLLPWNPDANSAVNAISTHGSFVYIGGSFGMVGGVYRKNIAALDAFSGTATPWKPDADSTIATSTYGPGFVTDIEAGNGVVYVAGNFSHIGGKSRYSLAAIDSATGMATGWNPAPIYDRDGGDDPGYIYDLALNEDASVVYVVGEITFIGGKERYWHLAAIDAVTGKATEWYPEESFEDVHYDIVYSQGRIYVTGNFIYVGGETRYFIASLDDSKGHATDWIPNPDNLNNIDPGPPKAVNGETVYVSVGSFDMLGGRRHRYLAALDAVTALAKDWQPNPDHEVTAIATGKGRVFIGGEFSQVGGETRYGLAAVDSITASATKWNPNLRVLPDDYLQNREVNELVYKDSTVYAGGQFATIARQPWPTFAVFPDTLPCTNPVSGGTIAADQSGLAPFDPQAFTSTAPATGYEGIRQYKWQSSTVGPNAGFTDIPGSASPEYDPGPLNQTTWFRRLARVDCKKDWSGAAASNVLKVDVECSKPESGGAIALGPFDICLPFKIATIVTSVPVDLPPMLLEYKWQSSVTGPLDGFTDIPGANSENHVSDTLYQTTWFKRLVRIVCSPDWVNAPESNIIVVKTGNDRIWLGGEGNWSTPLNWSGGIAPESIDRVFIPAGNPKMDVDFTVENTLKISGTGRLTVQPARTLTVPCAADFGNRPVVFKSEASGTAQLGTVSGTLDGAIDVTVERHIPATGRRWRLLTAPVDGPNINSVWQNGQTWNGSSPFTGDGTGTLITGQQQMNAVTANSRGFDFWPAIANSSASVMSYTQRPGQGVWSPLSNTKTANAFGADQAYLLFVRGPRSSNYSTGTANAATTLRPTGALKIGDRKISIDGTKGYTLIGNPYPSQIDFDSVYLEFGNSLVIKRQLWLWDATAGSTGHFQAVVYSGGKYVEVPAKFHSPGQASPLTAIQSGHGFFVLPLTSSGGTLRIRETHKLPTPSTRPNILLGEDRTPRVWLNLVKRNTDGTSLTADGVMASYGENHRMESTDAEDAMKLENLDENLAILNDGTSMTADARPISKMNEPIRLRSWNLNSGGYRFEAKIEGMEDRGINAFLEDRHKGTRTPLKMDGDITSIDLTVGEDQDSRAEDRFRIVFERTAVNASLTPETDGDKRILTVFPNPMTGPTMNVKLQNLPAGEYTLQLVGSDGRVVAARKVIHEKESMLHRIETGNMLAKGTYLVRCMKGMQSVGSEKVIVQ